MLTDNLDIYLLDPDGPELWIPVNPEEITVRADKRLETVDFLNQGEVDFAAGERIREISFNSFFPVEYDASYCRYPDIPVPLEAFEQLEKWTKSSKPVRLIISTTSINTLVMISAVQGQHRGGEPGDIYYELTCRTWRSVRIVTSTGATAPESAAPASSRPDLKPIPKVYIVKSGDTLSGIAKRELGSSSKWQSIYAIDENKKIIGPNPNLIRTGQRLVMPQ
jgi:LysM repeat protein